MNKIDRPEINASKLAAEVRKASKRQPHHYELSTVSDESQKKNSQGTDENDSTVARALSTSEPSTAGSSRRIAELEVQPVFEPSASDEYDQNDLLAFHDARFVKAVYRAVLKREPDSAGYNHYLQQLRAGHLDKIDILSSLRFSPEGERNGVKVYGLARSRFVRRLRNLPVIGYVFGLGIDLLRLPILLHRIRTQEAASWARSSKIIDHVNTDVADRINEIAAYRDETDELFRLHQQRLDDQISAIKLFLDTQLSEAALKRQQEVEQLISQQRTVVESLSRNLHTKISELESLAAIAHTETENLKQRIQHTRAELTLQARQPGILATAARRYLPESLGQDKRARADTHRLDALYSGLEDQFRGKRADIKERLKVYLPYIKAMSLGERVSIIDLGCGRGEWLELLKEHGFNPLGVETNVIFLEACRERNLQVVDSDALKYLSVLPDSSAEVITGFHIIEHLPMEVLISLLDEIMRVLRPGGLAIFETPNPENILVSSNYFYFDPTHLHPIPGLLMKFLMETRGMHGVEILNLHPWDEARIGGDSELTRRINELFYGPMDYAIMGSKVSG